MSFVKPSKIHLIRRGDKPRPSYGKVSERLTHGVFEVQWYDAQDRRLDSELVVTGDFDYARKTKPRKVNPTRYVIEEAYPIQRGSMERGTAPIMGWKVYRYTQRFPTVRAAKVWFMRHYDPDWERMPEDRCVDNFNRLSRNLKHFRVGREKF